MINPAPASEDIVQHTIEYFWETFPPVWNRIRGNLRLILAGRSELSLEQYYILRNLRNGSKTASELASAMQISRPAISQVLEALVEGGLVGRTQSVIDRRNIQLELTQDGNRLLSSLYNENRAWMKAKMAGLTPEEVACIHQSLVILNKTFNEPD